MKRLERWWKYEFCFDRHVRQYHDDEEGHILDDYKLGTVDSTAKPDNEIRVAQCTPMPVISLSFAL